MRARNDRERERRGGITSPQCLAPSVTMKYLISLAPVFCSSYQTNGENNEEKKSNEIGEMNEL